MKGTRLMDTTWILVCDAARARIFDVNLDEDTWTLVEAIDNPDGRLRAHELVSDGQGSVRQSGTGASPKMEAHTDPAEVEEDRFARELTHRMQQGFDAHRFKELMVVAPPKFLGRLRHHFGAPLQRAVSGSLAKDYTSLDVATLRKRLGG